MQAADRLVEITGQHQEGDEHAEIHRTLKDPVSTHRQDHHHAEVSQEVHRGAVEGPVAHDHQGGDAERLAGRVESGVLTLLGRVGLDLPDAVEVVVEEGVERGGRPARCAVALPCGERVGERPGSQKGKGDQGRQRQFAAVVGHQGQDDPDLQDRDGSLLDPVDQHALHIGHVLHQPGHDVAGRPVVEPRQGELLDPRVEIAAEIEDHPLLEVVVEHDAQGVEQILCEEGGEPHEDQRHQLPGLVTSEDIIDHPLGHGRKDRHHQRAGDGAEHRRRRHPGIARRVTEDPEQNSHGCL